MDQEGGRQSQGLDYYAGLTFSGSEQKAPSAISTLRARVYIELDLGDLLAQDVSFLKGFSSS